MERIYEPQPTIFGRAIKNEYLALATFGTTFGGAWLATRGGKTAQAKPTTVNQAKESVPINASSSEEEQFILNFIKEAEKEGSSAPSGH
ncbi:hypothetical protein GALMADRAFT_246833 [Galerina marginata CBS 339.88]|uniref:Uncharacterized protein n=1 Tax=Galerina marginata (strain CBS 339.88) TaxID=685588 RepID=A0A067T2F4_GALM3|nr:hypothetical protein GALMADRAFT_246833 [Galerina marginata CBS 339.88]